MESAETPLPDFTDHRRRPGRKLGRFQQYCLYAAMQLGASNQVIAQSFNLSRTTVSALRHAGEHNRYMQVWSEYYRLGHRDFCNTYRDDIITARINEARKRELESLGYGLPRGRPAQMAQYDHPHLSPSPSEPHVLTDATSGAQQSDGCMSDDCASENRGGGGGDNGQPAP